MSKEIHNHKPSANSEHGTAGAYVVGFVLSLIFTVIPYYLVVNKVISGSMLLAVILAIAVWQMIIQLVFFLHLGRGPKPLYNIVFFFATAGVILVTIGASLFIMDNLYRNMSPKEVVLKQAQDENISQVSGKDTGACTENRQNHVVIMSGGIVGPSYIETNRCDTLSFVNSDGYDYKLGFGNHPDDVSYGGLDEITIEKGKTEIITLNQAGEYTFHDHLGSELTGRFTVTP